MLPLVVNACNDLTQEDKKEIFIKELLNKQEDIRIRHAQKGERNLVSLADSRTKGVKIDWEKENIETPFLKNLGSINFNLSWKEAA